MSSHDDETNWRQSLERLGQAALDLVTSLAGRTGEHSVTGSGTTMASTIAYATLQEGNGQNGESEATNAPLPWTKTITASGLLTAFSLSAQNSGGGSITCTITEDGKVVDTNTATGQYASVTCTH